MVMDEELLAAARAAHSRLVDAERAADLARAEFRYSVRKLHLAGASLREVGEALNFSHQRVHQIVEEAGGGRGWRSFAGFGARPRPRAIACSFCGTAREQVRRLAVGPGFVAICDTCADKAGQVLATGEVAATPLSAIKPLPAAGPGEPAAATKCSFCGKGRHQVDGIAMAAGTTTAGVFICTECLALCRETAAG